MKIVVNSLIALGLLAVATRAGAGANILQNGVAEDADKSPKGWSQGATAFDAILLIILTEKKK
jgi:hypothetical protein